MSDTVLVVGRGLIGAATADLVRANGSPAVTVDRTGTDPAALRDLLARLRPRYAVLTHGPSDVTWIEDHETEAAAVHVGVAEVFADAGVPSVLVSTDNVFPGDEGLRTPAHPIRPGNAYGRVKARAEQVLLAGRGNLVLRVSLVYGWTGDAHRTTYGQRCLESALHGKPLDAPVDQSFTPIHVDDVARVLADLCAEPRTGVAHLAGPVELSRYDFATTAYRLAGADPDLVRPCFRCDTHWAARPRYSSLACAEFDVLSPEAGLARMLDQKMVSTP